MKLFRVKTWSHGSWHYCAALDPPRFVARRGAARLLTEAQADKLRKRFRKGSARMTLKLEEAPVPPEGIQLHFSEMSRD